MLYKVTLIKLAGKSVGFEVGGESAEIESESTDISHFICMT